MSVKFALWLLVITAVPAAAQQAKPSPTPREPIVQTTPREGIADPLAGGGQLLTPAMRAEDLLRIRNLQYEQDKKLIEMQQIEARYKELKDGIASDNAAINAAVRAGAEAVHADILKFVFDLDSLKLIPRQPQASGSPTPQPKEKKP
jgi:hypothetical protein